MKTILPAIDGYYFLFSVCIATILNMSQAEHLSKDLRRYLDFSGPITALKAGVLKKYI